MLSRALASGATHTALIAGGRLACSAHAPTERPARTRALLRHKHTQRTCATDSSNSSGSAPRSFTIFLRAVNILAATFVVCSTTR